VSLRSSQASRHPLADHLPLDLCGHAHHLEERLAGERGGVDALLVGVPDIVKQLVELLQERIERLEMKLKDNS